jgi:predicted MPP superfamily phosphohydrolase
LVKLISIFMIYLNAHVVIFLIILLLIDLYAFQAFRFVSRGYSQTAIRWINILYWFVSCFCFALIVISQYTDWHSWNIYFRTYSIGLLIILIPSKIILVLFVLVDDLVRFLRWLYKKKSSWFIKPEPIETINKAKTLSRSDFIIKTGLLIGSIPFFSMIYGMVYNAYKYQTRKLSLILPGLPSSFDGFRIVQISDIHTGSFLSTKPLTQAVNIINEQKPDVVFFTGDLVNYRHEEVLQYMEILKKIEARNGVMSIFGNHDYGDYSKWGNIGAKENEINELIKIHSQLGWNLLWDEHIYIEQNGEKIAVIGVQNCGSHVFSNYGSLEKATNNINYCPVNILLSHDPSHWGREVTKKYPNINLTLSGHTHGMQFGVEIPGFKWSPIQYIYKEWAGLYQEKNQYLYVNRGLGFIGYPGRVGILPEITVIELKKKEM